MTFKILLLPESEANVYVSNSIFPEFDGLIEHNTINLLKEATLQKTTFNMYWSPCKMAAILQMTFSNAFS